MFGQPKSDFDIHPSIVVTETRGGSNVFARNSTYPTQLQLDPGGTGPINLYDLAPGVVLEIRKDALVGGGVVRDSRGEILECIGPGSEVSICSSDGTVTMFGLTV